VEEALVLAQEYLGNFASEPDFGQKMATAFGEGANVDSLRTAWSANDFSNFPEIEVRHAADINGANGAFAAATNKIYLSQEFINSNTSQPHAIANVLLEEFGHWVDSRINLADTPGDKGEIFSAFVRGESFNQQQLQALKSEDDTALVTLDGQVLQIEQSTVPNQVLWSQRIGKSFEDTFSIGSLVGLPNAKTWNTQDIFGKPLRSLGLGSLIKNDVLGLDTSFGPISMPEIKVPKISLAGAVSAEANAKVTIAGPNNSSQAANIKAGLQVNAGYSLGEVKLNLPLFTDTSLSINNGFLDFESTLDKRGAFLDYISTYFKLDVQGIFESKAAAYITGGASL
ncbi:MAG: calcium-binding protein, partial [Nostoc sp.]